MQSETHFRNILYNKTGKCPRIQPWGSVIKKLKKRLGVDDFLPPKQNKTKSLNIFIYP